MADNKNTQYFKVNNETDIAVKDILEAVYIALTEKGYNPVNQIVGYIMSVTLLVLQLRVWRRLLVRTRINSARRMRVLRL